MMNMYPVIKFKSPLNFASRGIVYEALNFQPFDRNGFTDWHDSSEM